MVDVRKPAVLRVFPVANVGDQVHLCHPSFSFEGGPTLYLAHRFDWRNVPEALTITDPKKEASTLGTLLPAPYARSLVSGEGSVVAESGFVQAVAPAGVEVLDSETPFVRVDGSGCWIVATPVFYTDLKSRLADKARAALDEALAHALRRDDFAVWQLAGARKNREPIKNVVRTGVGIEPVSTAALGANCFKTVLVDVNDILGKPPIQASEWQALQSALGVDLLARLLDILPANIDLYLSGTQTPDKVALRFRELTWMVHDLAGAYNDDGIRRWFARPRTVLGNRAPVDVLTPGWLPDDPEAQRVRGLANALTVSPAT